MTDHSSGPSPTRLPPSPTIEDEENKVDSEELLRAICSQNGVDHLVPDEGTTNDFYDDLLPDDHSEPMTDPTTMEDYDD